MAEGHGTSEVSLHIGLIGSAHFGTDEPFAGGLEALVATLATRLGSRGHTVTLLPGERSTFVPSEVARGDVSATSAAAVSEHHAYLQSLLTVADSGIDVLHNHSVHYLPVALAPALPPPMVTTLHSPPTPWLESAFAVAPGASGPVVSVSEANAAQWRGTLGRCEVVSNGVDVERFRAGAGGGGYAAWFGRIVPEKGVTSAIEAARRAGMELRIAGPIHDRAHFDRHVAPALGDDVEYVGHLDTEGLNELVGNAEVSLVTPHWEEPYGLVVAESLAMGTPVAAYARGGIGEVLGPECGRMAAAGDVDALARALTEASELDRTACRRWAEEHCDVETMVDRYEALYRQVLEEPAWRR